MKVRRLIILLLFFSAFNLFAQQETLKIVTFNIEMLFQGTDKMARFEAFIKSLKDMPEKPDIIALQEFYFLPSDNVFLNKLKANFYETYYIRTGIPYHGNFQGQKFPPKLQGSGLTFLISKKYRISYMYAEPWSYFWNYCQKGFFHLKIVNVEKGFPLNLINAHLQGSIPGKDPADIVQKFFKGFKEVPEYPFYGEKVRKIQLTQIKKLLETIDNNEPVLFMGDFNLMSSYEYPEHPFLTHPIHNEYKSMLDFLEAEDTWAELHNPQDMSGITYDTINNTRAYRIPATYKLIMPQKFRLDYILKRDFANVLQTEKSGLIFTEKIKISNKKETNFSDHFGIQAVFTLNLN